MVLKSYQDPVNVVYCESEECETLVGVKPVIIAKGYLIRCERCNSTMSSHRYDYLLHKKEQKPKQIKTAAVAPKKIFYQERLF